MNAITSSIISQDKNFQIEVQKFSEDANIPSDKLNKIDSFILKMFVDDKETVLKIKYVFASTEFIELGFEKIFGILGLFRIANTKRLSDMHNLCKNLNISAQNWLNLSMPKSEINTCKLYKSPIHFCIKNHLLVTKLGELGIPLNEIISSAGDIENNSYFANLGVKNFEILCKSSSFSPLQLLKLESKRFVFLLTNAKVIEKFINYGYSDFNYLIDSSLEVLKEIFLYRSKDFVCFIKQKHINLSQDSKYELKKLFFDIYPVNGNNELDFPLKSFEKKMINLLFRVIDNEMKNINKQYEKSEISFIEKLQKMLTFARDIDSLYKRELFSNKYTKRLEIKKEIAVQLLVAKLTELHAAKDPEDPDLIFPGGWKKHAVMLGISVEHLTKKFSFSIWNTGQGVENHYQYPKVQEKFSNRTKYQIRAKWSNLTLNQVANPSFLGTLLEEKVTWNTSDPQKVYGMIQQHFGKKQDPISENILSFHKAQDKGNCLWKSIWAASADILGREKNPLLSLKIKYAFIETVKKEMLEIPKEKREKNDDALIRITEEKERAIREKIIHWEGSSKVINHSLGFK